MKHEQREKIEDYGTKPKLRFSADQKEEEYVGHKDDESYQSKENTVKIDNTGFIMKPYIGTFSGFEPKPKNESSFEDWRMEVENLMAFKIYPEFFDIASDQEIIKSAS